MEHPPPNLTSLPKGNRNSDHLGMFKLLLYRYIQKWYIPYFVHYIFI